MSTFTVLTGVRATEGSIRNWVNREATPATTILTEAQALIYEELRVREMQQSTTGTLAIDDDTIDLSSVAPRFRAPISFFFTANGTATKYRPRMKLLSDVLDAWEYDSAGARVPGGPSMWAYEGSNIQFDRPTDIARPWRLSYYGALAALGTSNETNFLTDRFPSLLRAACMFKAAEFWKDDAERRYWTPIFADEIMRANAAADRELEGIETAYDYEAT